MKYIYFHLNGGAAGDMLLSSLIELGCPVSYLKKEFKKLNIKFDIAYLADKTTPCHVPKRKLKFSGPNFTSHSNIVRIIKKSQFSQDIKQNAQDVYEKIAAVERKIHKSKNIHYHHLGEIDAILEICGFFIALKYLSVERIYVSQFPLSKPAPATLELLRGKKIKAVSFDYESITPTAAALLSCAKQVNGKFSFVKSSFGWGGCGDKDYLTAYLCDDNLDHDKIIKIETNIDDMNPQIFESVFSALYKAGAKEVYLEQVLMKKNRPAVVLNVLCLKEQFNLIRDIIFSQTTTFGLRYLEYARDKLPYKFIYKNTKFGKLKFRQSVGKFSKSTPEYSDCFNLSQKLKKPLKKIFKSLS